MSRIADPQHERSEIWTNSATCAWVHPLAFLAMRRRRPTVSLTLVITSPPSPGSSAMSRYNNQRSPDLVRRGYRTRKCFPIVTGWKVRRYCELANRFSLSSPDGDARQTWAPSMTQMSKSFIGYGRHIRESKDSLHPLLWGPRS